MRFFVTLLLCFFLLAFVYRFRSLHSAPYNNSAVIKNSELDEISGLVCSSKNKNLIWVHNDGRKNLSLYLIDTLGNTVKTFTSNSKVLDFEDIAIDTGVVNGISYIYAGDIGDNFRWRSTISVYRIPEPGKGDNSILPGIEEIKLTYPDGSRDAEAMFADPISKQLYILSKREQKVGIYAVPLTVKANKTYKMRKLGELEVYGEGDSKWITGADISRDGLKILVRTYANVFYWNRRRTETIEQALKSKPAILKCKYESQGEAIGFKPGDRFFYSVSEGDDPFLNLNSIR